MSLLNGCQTNAAILEALRKSGNSLNLQSLPEMRDYVKRIGYPVAALDTLNIIHIAGTKGKGSTSAFCDSILRRFRVRVDGESRPVKTGLFTSPHLVEVRERIRINGTPISKDTFAKNFYHVWDSFENAGIKEKPGYFRFLYLVACQTFFEEKVDFTVIECGVGGEYDATNIIQRPLVCAITTLGMDHCNLLGHTIQEIAWHKAGIIKRGVGVVVSRQVEEAMEVIKARAKEKEEGREVGDDVGSEKKECSEVNVYSVTHEEETKLHSIRLGIAGAHQNINAAVAKRVCEEIVKRVAEGNVRTLRKRDGFDGNAIMVVEGTEEDVLEGLRTASWPGRSQTLVNPRYPKITWMLDGAHTPESLQVCADWFKDTIKEEESMPSTRNALLFNCTGGRDAKELLRALADIQDVIPFDKVMFCTNDVLSTSNPDATNHTVQKDTSLTVQTANKEAWLNLVPGSEDKIELHQSIDAAVFSLDKWSRTQSMQCRILVTGSLHLIGGFLTFVGAEVQ